MRLFLDTEFTDFMVPRLISFGFVTEDGLHKFYGEVNWDEWMGKESDFVRENIVPLLEGPPAMATLQELQTRLLKWLRGLPYPELQIIIDTQTDWDLVVQEVLQDYGPEKLVSTPSFLYVELCVVGELHALQFQLTSKEKTRRQLDAENVYRRERYYWFENAKSKQHHSLRDAEAMHHGFLAAVETIYRGLYRPLQQ